MREAFGGILIFQIIMVFIVIFIGIMAVGMNYATTFRAKNQVVHILEKYETYDKAKDHITAYLLETKYHNVGADAFKTKKNAACLNRTGNYCVIEAAADNGGYYYIVTTYVVFDFPIIGKFIQSPVTGKTAVLKDLSKIK